MARTNRETIPTDVADYLGWTEKKLRACELTVAPDPSIEGVAALRLKTRSETIDMLWTRDAGPTGFDRIEECVWTSFPPRSR